VHRTARPITLAESVVLIDAGALATLSGSLVQALLAGSFFESPL